MKVYLTMWALEKKGIVVGELERLDEHGAYVNYNGHTEFYRLGECFTHVSQAVNKAKKMHAAERKRIEAKLIELDRREANAFKELDRMETEVKAARLPSYFYSHHVELIEKTTLEFLKFSQATV